MGFTKRIQRMSSFQIIIFSFLSVIIVGTLLLMTPFASASGKSAAFEDALFTTVSAVCVTGLVVRDTALSWSYFGQAVILALIQTGGLGVVLTVTAISIISGKRISLKQRNIMQDSISAPSIGGIVRLTKFILGGIFISEAVGALLMSPVFVRDFGLGRGIWFSIFHSVSAFCNAGFDLLGSRGAYSSLISYQSDILINVVIAGLIIWGGLGFLTWHNIITVKGRHRHYTLQTRLILVMTLILIVLPSVLFFFLEFNGLPMKQRILQSVFTAVTPRTAGFATVDLNTLSEPGQIMIILLMLTGGAPGSTAGGMKVTTAGVFAVSVFAVLRRQKDTNLLGRRVDPEIIRNAAAIAGMYVLLFLGAGMLISRIENLPLLTSLFETASAIGTVGLTLGITPELCSISRIILILLMFLGRVGGLTFIFAILPDMRYQEVRQITEHITVG